MSTTERGRVEPWPLVVMGLLAAMIAGSVAFYRVARAHPDPLVVHDTWRAGRAYSEEVRAERHAEALGWQVALRAAPAEDGARIVVTVRGADGRPLEPERVEVRRVRPAEGGLDARFELEGRDGVFRGRVPLPRPGRWRLVVRAERGADAVERTFALRAPVRPPEASAAR